MLWLFQNCYRRTDFENLSKLFPLVLLHLCAFGGGGGEAPRGYRTQAVKLSTFTVDEENPPQWYSDLFSQSYVEGRGPRGTPETAYSNSASTNSCCFSHQGCSATAIPVGEWDQVLRWEQIEGRTDKCEDRLAMTTHRDGPTIP